MKIISYLNFDGQCEEAFKFYAEVLRGQVAAMMPFGDMPGGPPMSDEDKKRIMHGRIVVGDQLLFGSDGMPGDHYEGIKGAYITLSVDTAEEADRIYNALAAGGDVRMPIQETFFAERFGMVADRYGVPFMVIKEKAMG
jgi:PhnB protein